jgi:hypothetical protein
MYPPLSREFLSARAFNDLPCAYPLRVGHLVGRVPYSFMNRRVLPAPMWMT